MVLTWHEFVTAGEVIVAAGSGGHLVAKAIGWFEKRFSHSGAVMPHAVTPEPVQVVPIAHMPSALPSRSGLYGYDAFAPRKTASLQSALQYGLAQRGLQDAAQQHELARMMQQTQDPLWQARYGMGNPREMLASLFGGVGGLGGGTCYPTVQSNVVVPAPQGWSGLVNELGDRQ